VLFESQCLRLGCAATTVAANAANAIDQFCTDYVNNVRKATPTAEAVRVQVAANPGIFMNLLTFIFQLVVFDDTAHQWTLSRALLAVILAAELVRPDVCIVVSFAATAFTIPSVDFLQSFEGFKMQLIATQPVEVQPRLVASFDALMKDISKYEPASLLFCAHHGGG
jgi:hypothetical protein